MAKCKFSNFDCVYEENPEDVEICKACASIKSAEIQRDMINVQKMQGLATLAASLPYEEQELQDKVNERIKEMLGEWLEKEEQDEENSQKSNR